MMRVIFCGLDSSAQIGFGGIGNGCAPERDSATRLDQRGRFAGRPYHSAGGFTVYADGWGAGHDIVREGERQWRDGLDGKVTFVAV